MSNRPTPDLEAARSEFLLAWSRNVDVFTPEEAEQEAEAMANAMRQLSILVRMRRLIERVLP